jgi:hypothetical protein
MAGCRPVNVEVHVVEDEEFRLLVLLLFVKISFFRTPFANLASLTSDVMMHIMFIKKCCFSRTDVEHSFLCRIYCLEMLQLGIARGQNHARSSNRTVT